MRYAHPFARHRDLWMPATSHYEWVERQPNEQAITLLLLHALGGQCPGLGKPPVKGPSRGVVIDVGANGGSYTVLAATCGADVYAFEVQPVCLESLEQALAANLVDRRRTRIFPHPVSDRTRALTLPTNMLDCNLQYSFTRTDHVWADTKAWPRKTYTTAVLDQVLPAHVHVNFLKIDTEGHDPQVLAGARRLLDARRVDFIAVEASPKMWSLPFSPVLALEFARVLSFGYHAVCLSEPVPWAKITADTIVPLLTRGALQDCVDLVLWRNDLTLPPELLAWSQQAAVQQSLRRPPRPVSLR